MELDRVYELSNTSNEGYYFWLPDKLLDIILSVNEEVNVLGSCLSVLRAGSKWRGHVTPSHVDADQVDFNGVRRL